MSVYHYTSINAVLNIIQDKELRFHATFFKKFKGEDYDIIQPIGSKVVKELCRLEGEPFSENDDIYQPCIISFCKNGDSDYMWKNYADCFRGAMLIIDVEELKKCAEDNWMQHGDSFRECSYQKEGELEKNIKQYLMDNKDNKPKTDDLQNDWTSLLGFVKVDRYSNEEEYRYVRPYPVICTARYDESCEGNCNMELRPEPNKDRYYEDVSFPKKALKGIQFGELTTLKEMDTVKKHLERCGYILTCHSNGRISLEIDDENACDCRAYQYVVVNKAEVLSIIKDNVQELSDGKFLGRVAIVHKRSKGNGSILYQFYSDRDLGISLSTRSGTIDLMDAVANYDWGKHLCKCNYKQDGRIKKLQFTSKPGNVNWVSVHADPKQEIIKSIFDYLTTQKI